MYWRPIQTAPKGEFREVPVGNKGGFRLVHVPEFVLAPTSAGNVVMTYWDDLRGKWSMFSKSHPPEYWMPLPPPPSNLGGSA